jgi:hypothetical protein
LGVLAAGLALVGCETAPNGGMASAPPPPPPMRVLPPPPPPPPPAFRPDELAWSTLLGPNVLTGIVAFRRSPTDRWTCAGETLSLIPDGRYSRERMFQVYGSTERSVVAVGEARRRSIEAGPAAYQQYVRKTQCNAQSRFAFRALPDGSYFLLALARPAKPRPGAEPVAILEHVMLQGGGVRQVVIPRAR